MSQNRRFRVGAWLSRGDVALIVRVLAVCILSAVGLDAGQVFGVVF